MIDEFTSDLCKIEIQLASQPYIEAGNVAQMSNEIEVIRVKKLQINNRSIKISN